MFSFQRIDPFIAVFHPFSYFSCPYFTKTKKEDLVNTLNMINIK